MHISFLHPGEHKLFHSVLLMALVTAIFSLSTQFLGWKLKIPLPHQHIHADKFPCSESFNIIVPLRCIPKYIAILNNSCKISHKLSNRNINFWNREKLCLSVAAVTWISQLSGWECPLISSVVMTTVFRSKSLQSILKKGNRKFRNISVFCQKINFKKLLSSKKKSFNRLLQGFFEANFLKENYLYDIN